MRSCLNKIGPVETLLINTAINSANGIRPGKASKMSRASSLCFQRRSLTTLDEGERCD